MPSLRSSSVQPDESHRKTLVPIEGVSWGQITGGDLATSLQTRRRCAVDGLDIAHAVLFLASDETRHITGTEIVVDGGMTARCD
jgi:NAD(P)-dependent dehydrogenase (short-subunit alcohol dehydrogenase family)